MQMPESKYFNHFHSQQSSKIDGFEQQSLNETKRIKSSSNYFQQSTSHYEWSEQNYHHKCKAYRNRKFANEYQAKYYSLFLIQDLIRLFNLDIYAYSIMLEILLRISFETDYHTICKVTLATFHLASKFCSATGPRLLNLIQVTNCGVRVNEVIECEGQLFQGLSQELPLNIGLNYDQIRALCFQYQTMIFYYQR